MRPEDRKPVGPDKGRQAGGGLTDEERRELRALTGAGRVEGSPESHGGEGSTPGVNRRQTPTTGELTGRELEVRRAALRESRRVAVEELPKIFKSGTRSLVAGVTAGRHGSREEPTSQKPVEDRERSNQLVRLLTLPERRLGPVMLSGLGLAGILLLIVLLIVLLVKVFTG